ILGRHAATRDRDVAKALIGRDRDGGGAKGQALSKGDEAPQDAALLELGLEKLGADIVMVEDVAHAERAERQRDEKDQVGRVAAMDHVDAAPAQHAKGKAKLVEKRDRVFEEIFGGAGGFLQLVAVNLDPVDDLEARVMA